MKQLLVILLALFLVPKASHAVQGGISGGGGHEIESAFRVKVMDLLRQAQAMNPQQKQLLKFNPTAAIARPEMPNAFKPLCGSDEEAAELKDMNKMAFVKNPASGIVVLDCTNYKLAEWQSLYSTQQVEKAPFFLHEAMRILKIPDDDYSASSSFIDAIVADPRAEMKQVVQAMEKLITRDPRGMKCSIIIWQSDIVFGANGRKIDRVRYYGLDKSAMQELLLSPEPILNSENIHDKNKDHLEIERWRKHVYLYAKRLGCF